MEYTTHDLLCRAYENSSEILEAIRVYETYEEKTGYLSDRPDYLESCKSAYKHLFNLERQEKEHRTTHAN